MKARLRKRLFCSCLIGVLVSIGANLGFAQTRQHKIVFLRSDLSRSSEIYEMDADGSRQSCLVKDFDWASFVLSPNGRNIAFSSNRLNAWLDELFLMDLHTRKHKRLTDKLAYAYNPAFSPDSKKIVVMAGYSDSRGPGHDFRIYILDIATSELKQLTKGTEDWEPGFSPDGKKIVFASGPVAYPSEGQTQKREIYVINLSGASKTRLTNNEVDDNQPVYSPNGKQIAFVRSGDIYVMNADGTAQTQLTTHAASDSSPAYSPDGKLIAFVSHRDGNDEIYTMNADGTNQKRLTNNGVADRQPTWK